MKEEYESMTNIIRIKSLNVISHLANPTNGNELQAQLSIQNTGIFRCTYTAMVNNPLRSTATRKATKQIQGN